MRKRQMSLYIPVTTYESGKTEAAKEGIPLSQYFARQLSGTSSQIDGLKHELKGFIAEQFNELKILMEGKHEG